MTPEGWPATREEIERTMNSKEFYEDLTGYSVALEQFPTKPTTLLIREFLDKKYGPDLMEAVERNLRRMIEEQR